MASFKNLTPEQAKYQIQVRQKYIRRYERGARIPQGMDIQRFKQDLIELKQQYPEFFEEARNFATPEMEKAYREKVEEARLANPPPAPAPVGKDMFTPPTNPVYVTPLDTTPQVVKGRFEKNLLTTTYRENPITYIHLEGSVQPQYSPPPQGVVREAEINKGASYYLDKTSQEQTQQRASNAPVTPSSVAQVLGVESVNAVIGGGVAVKDIVVGAGQLLTKAGEYQQNPRQLASDVANFNPAEFREVIGEVGAGVKQNLIQDPGFSFGYGATTLLLPKLVEKGYVAGSNVYFKLGAKYVKPESVFSEQVLAQGKTFPMAESPQQALSAFQKSKATYSDLVDVRGVPVMEAGVGVDVSRVPALNVAQPTELLGTHVTATWLPRNARITPGHLAQIGGEDYGLFFTPRGQGSPHFLGLSEGGFDLYSKPSLLPKFSVPEVIDLRYPAVTRYSESLIQSKGFSEINEFLRQQAVEGKATAFISGRSERGLRGIFDKGLTTHELESVLPGDLMMSQIPEGNLFSRLRGSARYTTFNDRVVPIRTFGFAKSDSLISPAGISTEFKQVIKTSASRREIPTYTSTPTTTSLNVGYNLKPEKLPTYPERPTSRASEKNLQTQEMIYNRLESRRSSPRRRYQLEYYESAPSRLLYEREASRITPDRTPARYETGYTPEIYSPYTSTSRTPARFTPGRTPARTQRTPTPPPIVPPYQKPKRKDKEDKNGVYSVFTRKGGKWFRIAGEFSELEQALNKGLSVTSNTARASIKIFQGGKPINLSRYQNWNYQTGKKDPYALIQKTFNRISSLGEKEEITMKGLEKQRQKRKSRRWLNELF